MDRKVVGELHYITSVENLESIMRRGIVSHTRAEQFSHRSVALQEVQDIRSGKRVPNGLPLHEYANLYFDARNPMMYLLLIKDDPNDLAVVRVSEAALDIRDTVLTDGNAASGATRFFPSPTGLAALDPTLIYAKYWNDDDYWTKLEKKRARCAEVLVPDLVESKHIIGCYVDTTTKRETCLEIDGLESVTVRKELYFR